MNLTMETLTPLYGEAVARVLVVADDLASAVGGAPGAFDSPTERDLRQAVLALRGTADPVLRDPPEREALKAVALHLSNVDFSPLPQVQNIADRVLRLCQLYSEAKRAVETAKGCTDAVATTLRYQLAQANKRTAHERYNAAGPALDLASIRERLAEVECQHDPIHNLVNSAMAPMYDGEGVPDHVYQVVRELCCRVAGYVVIGRVGGEKAATR